MILEIFDVEHGACALVTTSNGRRIMIDCGHNATTNWRPGTFLAGARIPRLDQLLITNYDEDHVSGYPDLLGKIAIDVLVRNPSVLPGTIRFLKTEDGMGNGIDLLVRSIEGVFTGGAPPPIDDFGDTSFSHYWNSYGLPAFGFTDENNLSLVTFVKCGHHKIIFPGDMEKEGWRRLLQNPEFVQELNGVNLFVASHHGRENGYCEEVLDLCPQIRAFIISDKKKGHQTQETVDRYRQYASGFPYGPDIRRVLTTRRDSSMQFQLPPFGTGAVYLARLGRGVNRAFDFYEYAGVIVPGAVFTLGMLWLFPDSRALFSKEGVTFGELGLFIIIAYAAGQLIQGIGNWIEWLWWKTWGGYPSKRVLGGHLISADQHKRVVEALRKDGKVTADVTTCALPECLAIVREVYSVVAAAGKAGRVDIFNGNYGLSRGLAASLLVLLVAAIVLVKGLYVIGALVALLFLAVQRMHRFGKHYALELFIQYLLISAKPAGQ